MNIAITGSTGFVGNALKGYLKNYHSVTEVDLHRFGLDSYSFSGIDCVIHLAAIAHTKGISDDLYFKVNRDLAYATAQKAKKESVPHFIFMSTTKVYGDSSINELIFDEESICNPADAYGISKLEAEKLIVDLSDSSFCVSILRSPLVYGPGVKANMYNLIRFVDKFPILPMGGINNKRSLIFIENLTEFIKVVMEKKITGILIPSDLRPLSTSEIVFSISKSFNRRKKIIRFPSVFKFVLRTLSPYYYTRIFGSFIVDSSVSLNRLSFSVPFSSDYGINKTVKWYLENKNK